MRLWTFVVVVAFCFGLALGHAFEASAAVDRKESIDCRSTSIYEPGDTNPYDQPARQDAVSGGVTFACITGHMDSFVSVNIKSLSLARAVFGGTYKVKCTVKTPGFVPMRRNGFLVIYSMNVRCPAVRTQRTYEWQTRISYTLRAEWRSAVPRTQTNPNFNSYPVGLDLK